MNKKKKKLKIFQNQRDAQGILEVMVAISVVIIALVSIMSLVIFNINIQKMNHNILIASNLAREGVEIVRNIRDNNWLDSSRNWDDSLSIREEDEVVLKNKNSFITFNSAVWNANDFSYDIMPVGISWKDCFNSKINDGHSLCQLYLTPILNSKNIVYDHLGYKVSNSQATNFYRLIYINEICAVDNFEEKILDNYLEHCSDYGVKKIGIQVISMVTWKSSNKLIKVEERLYNWK